MLHNGASANNRSGAFHLPEDKLSIAIGRVLKCDKSGVYLEKCLGLVDVFTGNRCIVSLVCVDGAQKIMSNWLSCNHSKGLAEAILKFFLNSLIDIFSPLNGLAKSLIVIWTCRRYPFMQHTKISSKIWFIENTVAASGQLSLKASELGSQGLQLQALLQHIETRRSCQCNAYIVLYGKCIQSCWWNGMAEATLRSIMTCCSLSVHLINRLSLQRIPIYSSKLAEVSEGRTHGQTILLQLGIRWSPDAALW